MSRCDCRQQAEIRDLRVQLRGYADYRAGRRTWAYLMFALGWREHRLSGGPAGRAAYAESLREQLQRARPTHEQD